MLNKMDADICQSCERAVPIAEMNEDGDCAACVEARKPRFQPYGGAGPLPTKCCDFAVVDNSTGKEVCRVWNLEDARKIAFLLETHPHLKETP